MNQTTYTLQSKGRLLVMQQPIVMGIINVTPDSFYKGSRSMAHEETIQCALKFKAAGATIIDIGGASSRPGAEILSAKKEWERVQPIIEGIRNVDENIWISIDTYHAFVAEQAVRAGADIINDISAGLMDSHMLQTTAKCGVPYIMMHMKGTPETMTHQANYKDVTVEVIDYFLERMQVASQMGIKDIIIDPGFGFAKNAQHNFTLLKNLSALQILGKPILAGLSRKRMIYGTLGINAENALNGTTVLNTVALQNGAIILRVHDVQEAMECIQLWQQLQIV